MHKLRLSGARSLPVSAPVRTTFETIKDWFVQQATKDDCMIRASHIYPKDITTILRKNEQQFVMCHVQRYVRQNSEFDVKEMTTPQRRRPMSFTTKLNEWWCDCGEFQALRLPCTHVMVVCSYSHLDFTMFVASAYTLHNIFKAYEI